MSIIISQTLTCVWVTEKSKYVWLQTSFCLSLMCEYWLMSYSREGSHLRVFLEHVSQCPGISANMLMHHSLLYSDHQHTWVRRSQRWHCKCFRSSYISSAQFFFYLYSFKTALLIRILVKMHRESERQAAQRDSSWRQIVCVGAVITEGNDLLKPVVAPVLCLSSVPMAGISSFSVSFVPR